MRPGLQLGDCQERVIVVREDMQAQFEDGPVHPLYSTSALIQHMEWTARQHILPYLEPGEEGVGYHVDIKHLRPTSMGATVRIRSTVTEVLPKRVTSHVEAWNEHGKIGEGLLVQALVDAQQLYADANPSVTVVPSVLSDALACEDADVSPLLESDEMVPPVYLASVDGQTQFWFEVLKWETGLFPCTRYDEWLICRARFQQGERQQEVESAFLLRYEVEEWLQALQQSCLPDFVGFTSDFLEPVFTIKLTPQPSGLCHLVLTLRTTLPQVGNLVETSVTNPVISVAFILDVPMRQHLIQQLDVQLEGFPSRL